MNASAKEYYGLVVCVAFVLMGVSILWGISGAIDPFLSCSMIIASAAGGIGAVIQWDEVVKSGGWEEWEEEDDS